MSYEREINWNITGKDRKDARIAELEARVKKLEAKLDQRIDVASDQKTERTASFRWWIIDYY